MSSGRSWYRITAAAAADESAPVEVSIHDEIGAWGVSAKGFLAELKEQAKGRDVELSLHSPGGEVFDGWAIYNALKRHEGEVTVKVEGLAASMASVIAMAGDRVTMPENSYLMIHNPWSVAVGDAGEMREVADLLEKLGDGIVGAYAKRAGMDEDEVRTLMDAETWLTGREAVEMGFADVVEEPVAMAAVRRGVDISKWSKVPTNLMATETPVTKDDEVDQPAAETEEVIVGVDETPAEELAPADDPVVEVSLETDEPAEESAPEAKGFVERVLARLTGESEVGDLRAAIEVKDARISELEGQLEAQKKDLADLDALKNALAEADAKRTTVSEEAARIAASELGVTTEEVDDLPPVNADGSDLLDRFNHASPAERNAIFREHGAELKRLQSQQAAAGG
jgi:ATP-dependent protease ClpP protease subunit